MDINDKIEGNDYGPTEFNQFKNETQNTITNTGISLSSGVQTQLSSAISRYATAGDAVIDSGIANAYVLTKQGSFKAPAALQNGAMYRFKAGNTNTGASTVNINGIGIKDIKKNGLADNIEAGDITEDNFYALFYDQPSDDFELITFSSVTLNPVDPQWNSGFTYSLNEMVSATDGTKYVSQQNTNENHNPVGDDGTWWKTDSEVNGSKGRLVKFLTTSSSLTINESADNSVVAYLTSNEIKSGIYLIYAYGAGGGGGTATTIGNMNGGGGGGIYRDVKTISGTTPYVIGSGGAVDSDGGDTTILTLTGGGGKGGAFPITATSGDGGMVVVVDLEQQILA